MIRRQIFLPFAGTFAVLLLPACSRPDSAATPAPAPPIVEVTETTLRDVPLFQEWVASLDGSANVQIRARVQGYLIKQSYLDGSRVKKGDVLFEIDPRPFEAVLAQNKAEAARMQAAQLKTELDEKRQLKLFESRTASEQERDSAVQANTAAKAAVLAAEAGVLQAQLNLEYTRILSPLDGIAGIAQPGLGDLVGPSGAELTTVSTVDPIKVTFQLSEQEYLRYAQRINQRVGEQSNTGEAPLELILADGSTFVQKGRFTAVNRQVDTRTGTIEVAALFPNPGNILRPGIFARIRAVVQNKVGAILVPQRAVNEFQGLYQIAVVGPDGKGSIRRVKVGPRVDSLWVIEEGLKPGEKVVVEGIQKVREGLPVTAKSWMPPNSPQAAPTAKPAATSASDTKPAGSK